MKFFWISFSLLAISWGFALYEMNGSVEIVSWRLLATAAFFVLFFLVPLYRKNITVLTFILTFASLIAVITFWHGLTEEINLFTILAYSIISGKAVYRLPLQRAWIVGGILFLGTLSPTLGSLSVLSVTYIIFYSILLSTSFLIYRHLYERSEENEARNEALLAEYRKMKRQLAEGETLARQEERTQIAHEIHDSVGHKLTALIMHLEASRLKKNVETDDLLLELKGLAQESLTETRNAVKALKQDETGGLSVILHFLKKLEAENFIQIQFSVRHGALTVPLSGDYSAAIYRSVQEGLTNVMKHTKSRKVNILFEAPGGSVFIFEVSNPSDNVLLQEGFGLRSMRERLEKLGGTLDIIQEDGYFTLRGKLFIHGEGG